MNIFEELFFKGSDPKFMIDYLIAEYFIEHFDWTVQMDYCWIIYNFWF